MTDTCLKCNTPLSADQRFCTGCGADVVDIKQAERAYQTLRGRLDQLVSVLEPHERVRRVEIFLKQLETALETVPDYEPLLDLRREIKELGCEAARVAADSDFALQRYAKAMHFYQCLAAWGGDSDEISEQVSFIYRYREQQLGEAKAFLAQGVYDRGIMTLSELRQAFPDDLEIKEMHEEYDQVLMRVKSLLSSGLRELRDQRRFFALEKEIGWLEAQHIRLDKLSELSDLVTKRISVANATVTTAVSELCKGNVAGAQQLARNVLDAVADHEGAEQILRTSSQPNERVTELEELVRRKDWCAASELLGKLSGQALGDPRLEKLSARTKATIKQINFNILILAIVLGVVIAIGLFGVPWLASVATAPRGWGKSFFYYAWAAGAIWLVAITWLVSSNKRQVIRRTFFLIRTAPRRLRLPRLRRASGSSAG
jgi:hypothetical protein